MIDPPVIHDFFGSVERKLSTDPIFIDIKEAIAHLEQGHRIILKSSLAIYNNYACCRFSHKPTKNLKK